MKVILCNLETEVAPLSQFLQGSRAFLFDEYSGAFFDHKCDLQPKQHICDISLYIGHHKITHKYKPIIQAC